MKRNPFEKLLLVLFIVLFTVSPVFADAKNDNDKNSQEEKVVRTDRNDNNDDNDEKRVNLNRKCWKAYGYFFAFGWLKKNARPEIDTEMNCFLPFGIAKKFKRFTTASSTPDTAAPIISNIASTTGIVKATISWNTNENSDSTVFWSTTTPVAIQSASVLTNSAKVKNHHLNLIGLFGSTTYYAIVRSKDTAGNTATSSQFSFTTKSPAPVSDTVPPIIYSIVAVVGTSTANVGWQTNEPATSKVYYGTTTPLSKTASSTSFVESTALSLSHPLSISNLSTSTTYYVLVESKDAAANVQTSSQFSITTGS